MFDRIIFFYKVLKLSLQEKYNFFFSFPFCETEGIVVRMAVQLPDGSRTPEDVLARL